MSLYIGLMSGTSLDGVDGVLSSIPDEYDGGEIGILETAHVPFDGAIASTADVPAITGTQ